MNVVHGARLLSIENVSVVYKGRTIIRDISATVDDLIRPEETGATPQIVGFIGPSGSGKTTLFRVMSGLEQPTTGRVLLNQSATPVTPGFVGVVPQDYPLFDFMTVIDNITLGGRQAGLSKNDARQQGMAHLERYGLTEIANHYPIQCSGGQRQRVAIIRQFMCSSHFLLMDEPFSGLDPRARHQTVRMIWETASQHEQNTVIVTSHDIKSVALLADVIWILGREKAQDGSYIAGSTIIRRIDMVAEGFAWHHDLDTDPGFLKLVADTERLFDQI